MHDCGDLMTIVGLDFVQHKHVQRCYNLPSEAGRDPNSFCGMYTHKL